MHQGPPFPGSVSPLRLWLLMALALGSELQGPPKGSPSRQVERLQQELKAGLPCHQGFSPPKGMTQESHMTIRYCKPLFVFVFVFFLSSPIVLHDGLNRDHFVLVSLVSLNNPCNDPCSLFCSCTVLIPSVPGLKKH